MSLEKDVSNIGAKLTQVGGTLGQLTDDQYTANLDIANLNAKITTQGQNTMANSTPVVIASDQTAIPVTGAFSVVGGATSANQTNGTQRTQITDGVDNALVTAAGEQNVLATAQPGVDIGDVTVNNAAGAAAVNIQDGGNSITVDGTFFQATQPVSLAGTMMVQGDVANDAVDSGNPVKIGGVARTTLPTAVADGDRVNGMYSKMGKKVVVIGSVRELIVQNTVTLTTTAETTLIAAGAAGVFHDLTNIFVANTSGGSRRIDFRDATAGAVRFSINVGANISNTSAIPVAIIQITAANNWTVQMDAAATDVRVFASAIKNL